MILVPPSDPDTMARALRQALTPKWDTSAIRARAETYSWDSSAQALYHAPVSAVTPPLPPS